MSEVPSVREDLEFISGGVTCRAWAFRTAAGPNGRSPLLVMAHGLGATRNMGLAAFAERFAEVGISSLVFDYRHFGDSDGGPRQLLSISRQRADYLAAVRFARTLPWVDPARIGLWGSSFSGGHVIGLGPKIPGLAAVVAQCPFTDGRASVRALGVRGVLRVTPRAVLDIGSAVAGRPPVTVPVVARPGAAGLMTSPDAWPGYISLLPAEGPSPSIEVAARIGALIGLYTPGRALRRAACPTFVAVCDRDTVAPAKATLRRARRAPSLVEVHRYDYQHFDIYGGEPREAVLADEVAFLREHLLANR